jgi:hypothetical protein
LGGRLGASSAFAPLFCDDVSIDLQPKPRGEAVMVVLGEEGAKQRA